MTVPTSTEYSTAYVIAANTALKTLLEAEGTSGCTIKLYDSADTLLSSSPMTDPPASVNGTTGELTLSAPGVSIATGAGRAAYGSVCDALGAYALRLPCERGTVAVPNKLVLSQLTVIVGAEITIGSATIL